MIIDTIIKKNWNIPDELERKFNAKALKKFLRSFNQMSGGSYFFVDYYHKELIVDSSESRILCGYPKELVLKEGLSFFKRILKKEEMNWQKRLTQPIANVFFGLDEDDRQDLMLLYDMNVKMKTGEEQVLHYKIIPFQLCDNGNLWLALGCVSSSLSQEQRHNVCMVNIPKLTRYNLVDNEFVSSKISPLTQEEREILQLLVKNMLESDICTLLDIKKNKYHRLKIAMFEKLEVSTPAGAVQRAHHLGLI